jgi:hypothetical protein
MKLKCEELTITIMECFDNSMDNRFTAEERKEFLINGKRLRGSLINLLSADFNERTVEIIESNNLIKEINVSLKEKDKMLDNSEIVVGNITKLVSILDDLLKLAASFV